MDVLERVKASAGMDQAGFDEILQSTTVLKRNHDTDTLHQLALTRSEGELSRDGALVVDTGHHTGRSPQDKFIVRDHATDGTIAWGSNAGITREAFERLRADILDYVRDKELFVQDLAAGADPRHQINVRVFTEFAWHSMFIRTLLRTPAAGLDPAGDRLTIISAPGFQADPARYGIRTGTVIACDFTGRTILIAGTSYAGEIKKAVFTFLNYILPERGVLPMHCSANVGEKGDVAIFFGLSGTGKTTLSATADRTLIGDDEHGWGDAGIFNFEGGCYAKVIGLSAEDEPQIYAATNRYGTVLENVVLSPETRRAAVRRHQQDGEHARRLSAVARAQRLADRPGGSSDQHRDAHRRRLRRAAADRLADRAGRRSTISCPASPPRSPAPRRASANRSRPSPHASARPFMPRRPIDYGKLLLGLIREHRPNCWLVNTGWTGGPYGVGRRMPIKVTRALLDAALNGAIDTADLRKDERFGIRIPTAIEGVPTEILTPRATWADAEAYDRAADKLATMFAENFGKVGQDIDPAVAAAGPRLRA